MLSFGSSFDFLLRIPPRRKLSFILSSALILSGPVTAVADSGAAGLDDTLNFSFGAGMRYDNNLFRLSDSESPQPFLGTSQKSDWVYSTNAGIKLDKPYSLQRFQLDATLVDNKYRTYSFLDYSAFNYRAAWLWHLTPRVSGILLADQKQVLNNFSDFPNIADKSIQTNQTHLFTIDADIGAGVHVLSGLLDVRSRNSKVFEAVGNYQQEGAEAGIKYVAPSQNWISVVQRETLGKYRDRVLNPAAQLDSGFDQSETEANLSWRLTGKSMIDAKLGYIDRIHDHFSRRDYSGAISRLLWHWTPTGKLQFDLSLSRNLHSFQEAANSYFVADTLSVSPIWNYSAKTRFRFKYDYSDRDYRGAIAPTTKLRRDRVQSLLFSADWQATRKILVSGMLQRDRRNSNTDSFDYDSNAVSINAQFLF